MAQDKKRRKKKLTVNAGFFVAALAVDQAGRQVQFLNGGKKREKKLM